MNKKLIKTIASITCGLGVVTSIPFAIASCGKSSYDHLDPNYDEYDDIPTSAADFEVNDQDITGFSTWGKGKFSEWQNKNLNDLKFIPSGTAHCYALTDLGGEYQFHSTPNFIKAVVLPPEIDVCKSYYGMHTIRFNFELQKITFESNSFSFWGFNGTSDYGAFTSESMLNTIVFYGNTINICNKVGETISTNPFFKHAGENATKERVVYFKDSSLTNTQKQALFDTLGKLGLDTTIWKYK